MHRGGDRASAVRIYRKVLKADPDNANALNFLGMAAHQEGRAKEAERLLRQAIRAEPGNPTAHRNLGNLLIELDSFEEAARCYLRAIELDPEDALIHANLCVAYRRLGRYREAIEAGRRAARMAPGEMIAWYNLANALRADKKFRQAVAAYRKALELDPRFTPARDNLCRTTLAIESQSLLGRRHFRKTRRAYEQWLRHEPDNAVASFMLKAVQGESLPRAPDSVVSGLFDRSASTFEEHLARLEYRVPHRIGELLERELGGPGRSRSILDAGCGTGLCGPVLRPYARRLVGVDLSRGMLERARARTIYDELVEAELTDYLGACAERFDLVVFADTLCYFGDLQPVIENVVRVMEPGGRLLFSVERAAEGEARAGYRLHPYGRYSHAESYVETVLEGAGFHALTLEREILRLEVGEPVSGLMVTARVG